VRADGFAIHFPVGQDEHLGVAGQGELLLGVVFRLAEQGHEVHQLLGRHVLAAQQDGAVPVEGVDHASQGFGVGAGEVHVEDLGAEAGLQLSGLQLDGGGHRRGLRQI
jgi:hypothetical protein